MPMEKKASVNKTRVVSGLETGIVKSEKPPATKIATGIAKKTLVPDAPEPKNAPGDKHKRLSKAFSRPLDKKLKRGAVVRDCFSFPEVEYDHLVDLKKRLLAEGVDIKKSELLRAGLALLSSMNEDDMKVLLAKVPRIS